MTVFADTSYYLALLNPRDAMHAAALSISRGSHVVVVTTRWVLAEVGNHLASRNRALFRVLVENLFHDPNTKVLGDSDALFARGYELYVARLDKEWSLVDCISFEAMKQAGIKDALTADHHFKQAGFNALLL